MRWGDEQKKELVFREEARMDAVAESIGSFDAETGQEIKEIKKQNRGGVGGGMYVTTMYPPVELCLCPRVAGVASTNGYHLFAFEFQALVYPTWMIACRGRLGHALDHIKTHPSSRY